MSDRKGWLGGIKSVLSQIETTHEPRPETNEKIVELPRGLEKLRNAIVTVQNHTVEAQAERVDIEQARAACLQEIEAAVAQNAVKQRDLAHRLRRLQDEWVRITIELGIKAEIVPAPAPPIEDDGA